MLMVFKGKTANDEEVSGTITVPEVAHDTEENEYVVGILTPDCSRGSY